MRNLGIVIVIYLLDFFPGVNRSRGLQGKSSLRTSQYVTMHVLVCLMFLVVGFLDFKL